MKTKTIQARDVRAKLLARSDWIIENSIRAACGYTPRMPLDLIDFTEDMAGQRMVPEMKPLADLLKAIIPKMDVNDDMVEFVKQTEFKNTSNRYMQQCEKAIMMAMGGHITVKQAKTWIECMTPLMENESREKIVKAMEELK